MPRFVKIFCFKFKKKIDSFPSEINDQQLKTKKMFFILQEEISLMNSLKLLTSLIVEILLILTVFFTEK